MLLFFRTGKMVQSIGALVVFILLSGLLFQAHIGEAKSSGSNAIVDPPYWKAIEMLSEKPGSTVFVIDPMLNQEAVIFNLIQYTRYLNQEDSLIGRNITDHSRIMCSLPARQREGLRFADAQPLKQYCEHGLVDICDFDYVLVHLMLAQQSQQQWLTNQINILQQKNMTMYYQEGSALILQNTGGCT